MLRFKYLKEIFESFVLILSMQNTVDYNNLTDEQLVKSTLQDQAFFLHLMKRYEQKLLRYIHRISKVSAEEAEDILQEVFIKVYRNLNNFDQNLKFSSWIYRITHNEVISNFRKRSVRPQNVDWDVNESFFNNIASTFDIKKELEAQFTAKEVEKILNMMDKKYREVLVLKFLEEKDYQEISDILKKPLGTVATLINRAKKKFRQHLETQESSEILKNSNNI